MRRDVLSLIVGWTMVAMLIPLSFSFLVTWWLDGLNTAAVAFLIPLLFSGLIGVSMLSIGVRSDTTERLRDREAFAAVALAWPVAVLVGSLPFWLGGVFHGPFTDGSLWPTLQGDSSILGLSPCLVLLRLVQLLSNIR